MVKPETLTHKTKHTVGLKMPLGGSTLNFRQFRHGLAKKGNNRSKVSFPSGDSVKDIKSSIRAYGWSQNTSKRLHVKFQVKPTTFDPPSTFEQQNQASQRREPPRLSLIKQSTWVTSTCFQRAACQVLSHLDNI